MSDIEINNVGRDRVLENMPDLESLQDIPKLSFLRPGFIPIHLRFTLSSLAYRLHIMSRVICFHSLAGPFIKSMRFLGLAKRPVILTYMRVESDRLQVRPQLDAVDLTAMHNRLPNDPTLCRHGLNGPSLLPMELLKQLLQWQTVMLFKPILDTYHNFTVLMQGDHLWQE